MQAPIPFRRGSKANQPPDLKRTDTVKILQLTDTHLYADPSRTLLGVNTLQSFRKVVELARDNETKPDIILATGDLVHDGSVAGYKRMVSELASFDTPVFCLPGNHDELTTMHDQLPRGRLSMPGHVEVGPWLIVLLDSTIPGKDGGQLAADELQRLDQLLATSDQPNVLVTLHHQPIPVGSTWLDTMTVTNGTEFMALVDRHERIKGVLWGHVHQTYEGVRNGKTLLATPSTCVQFTPGKAEFEVDGAPPGYRYLELQSDGGIVSRVHRIEGALEGVDLASVGY